jgi:hypothetical protein
MVQWLVFQVDRQYSSTGLAYFNQRRQWIDIHEGFLADPFPTFKSGKADPSQ